ncbi:hypothetical protein [uncultured Bacteroides sp.]|uniref:hypothetical protein n=1 Tax=uncultured Bacteroides sp. TaxID=162156 RepID=UPI0025DC565C|nr:hypothetical protein [uncultured Bacteroides sp.]
METRVSSEGNGRFLQWEPAFLRMETNVSSIGSDAVVRICLPFLADVFENQFFI